MAHFDAHLAHPVPHLLYPRRAAAMIVAVIATLFIGMLAMEFAAIDRINAVTANGEGF